MTVNLLYIRQLGGKTIFSCSRRQRPKTLILCVVLVLVAATLSRAQQPREPDPPGIANLDSVTVSGATLTLRAGQDTVTVQIVEPNILRVDYQPHGPTS